MRLPIYLSAFDAVVVGDGSFQYARSVGVVSVYMQYKCVYYCDTCILYVVVVGDGSFQYTRYVLYSYMYYMYYIDPICLLAMLYVICRMSFDLILLLCYCLLISFSIPLYPYTPIPLYSYLSIFLSFDHQVCGRRAAQNTPHTYPPHPHPSLNCCYRRCCYSCSSQRRYVICRICYCLLILFSYHVICMSFDPILLLCYCLLILFANAGNLAMGLRNRFSALLNPQAAVAGGAVVPSFSSTQGQYPPYPPQVCIYTYNNRHNYTPYTD
jgi:hypothetical protein